MPILKANGIELCYDEFGEGADDPILMIMGLGAQMILWDEDFLGALAKHGHRVIRFDNRDVGLSTKFDSAGPADVPELMRRSAAGEPLEVAYSLDDMADDAAGLLDALEITRAHVVGASMGGMIAQNLAIRHPARVRSLISIMSSTGNPELPPAKPEALAMLMLPPVKTREEAIERNVASRAVIGSPGFAVDEARLRRRAGELYDRCFYPVGTSRQLAAILAQGSRVDALRKLEIPTLVIHGTDDALVPVEGGKDTAGSIPGAKLLLIDGMGHELPVQLFARISEAICNHTKAA